MFDALTIASMELFTCSQNMLHNNMLQLFHCAALAEVQPSSSSGIIASNLPKVLDHTAQAEVRSIELLVE